MAQQSVAAARESLQSIRLNVHDMRPGAGAYPLRGHNNVQGASDFGSMPNYYPGYQAVNDAMVREKFEKGWGVLLPAGKGLDNHEMVDAIQEGKLKAIYLKGEDMITSDSNANLVGDALSKLEFFVVQDIVMSETARFADVILPASPSLEKEGTFTNTERRIQRLYQAFDPLAESRPDWRIVRDLANELGANWNYVSYVESAQPQVFPAGSLSPRAPREPQRSSHLFFWNLQQEVSLSSDFVVQEPASADWAEPARHR